VTIGLFAFNRQGIEGAMMVMLATAWSRARSSSASA
jgi:NADH:ubiquinone oxidoreductase subunit 4 (subunit M)